MIFTSTIVTATAIAISTVTASIATIAAGASFFYCSLY